MEFVITVTKDGDDDASEMQQLLQFGCEGDGLGSFDIKTVSFDVGDSPDPYLGPTFDSLEPDLKNAFMGYLAKRGIDDELANFIFDFKDYKENKEYIAWLEKVSAFIGKK